MKQYQAIIEIGFKLKIPMKLDLITIMAACAGYGSRNLVGHYLHNVGR